MGYRILHKSRGARPRRVRPVGYAGLSVPDRPPHMQYTLLVLRAVGCVARPDPVTLKRVSGFRRIGHRRRRPGE